MDGGWMGWVEARSRAEAAGLAVKGKLPSILLDWVQSGLVPSRAATLVVDDTATTNSPIPPRAWQIARAGLAGRVDWATGYVQCRITMQPGQRPVFLKAHGPQFSRIEMDRLAPKHSDALCEVNPEPEPKPLSDVPTKIPSSNEWQRQTRDSPTLRMLHNFLRSADEKNMLVGQTDHRSYEFLFKKFEKYCADAKAADKTPAPIDPQKFSAFKKWAKRFREGTWGERVRLPDHPT